MQPNTSDKDIGYAKHQRLDGLAFTMHRKLPDNGLSFTIDITKVTNFYFLAKFFNDDYIKFLNLQIIRH